MRDPLDKQRSLRVRADVTLFLALIASFFPLSLALANSAACSALLLKAVTEPDPVRIQATLAHVLASDHPILYTARATSILQVALQAEYPGFFVYPNHSNGSLHVANLMKFAEIADRLRQIKLEDPERLDRLKRAVWENLLADFLGADRAAAGWRYPEIPRETLGDVTNILKAIDEDSRLRDGALALVEESIVRLREWIQVPYRQSLKEPAYYYYHPGSARKISERLGMRRAELALPTLESMRKVQTAPPPLLSIDYARFRRKFEAADEVARLDTSEAVLRFDREILTNYRELSLATVNAHDQFATYPIWPRFYDLASEWALAGARAKTDEPKMKFAAFFSPILKFVDDHLDSLREAERALAAALAQAARKIQRLEEIGSANESFLAADRSRALGRLRDLEIEMKNLRSTLAEWIGKTEGGRGRILSLREAVVAGPIAVVKPDELRIQLEEVRSALELDPALLGRLQKTSWWPWKWF